jgi:ABC-2 type transport system ATP-binding protein
MVAIRTEGLRRSFGHVHALDGFDVALPSGQVCALVGPNGAGKTTLLLILAGLLAPDRGTVSIDGVDPAKQPFEVHRMLGWMPDFFGTYDDLTSLEYLELFGAAYRLQPDARAARARELLHLVGLESLATSPVHTLSRGQKQRLGFARSIVHSPRILLLDEPASGLDPRARIELRDLVRRQRAEGVTVVISSHILTELEEMADIVAFVDGGRCRGVYPMAELPSASKAGKSYRIRALNPIEDALAATGCTWQRVSAERAVVEVPSEQAAADLVVQLVAQGVRVIEMTPLGGGLEDAFLAMDRGARS